MIYTGCSKAACRVETKINAITPEIARSLATAFAGFVGYGAWAYYVNAEHGMWVGVKALFTQGGYSFTLTLIMTLIMEKLYKKTGRVLATAIPICFGVYLTSFSINALAGTPNILQTIAPGAFISTVYTFVYLLSLKKIAGSTAG
mgnify:CR=1 FL=1